MSFRTYHEVAGDDRSGLLSQVIAQRERVRRRMETVRRIIAVMSGKGGVGKSFVTTSLATALAPRCPRGVGVLDADLAGPTVARLLGARGPLRLENEAVLPALGRDGIKVVSTELLLPDDQPLAFREPNGERFVWRGALETGTVREFLSDVEWGTLDLLLIDLPPGTGRIEDLAQLLPQLDGAIAITIPSEESRASVARSMHAAAKCGVRLHGVIENMSGYSCDGCSGIRPLFPGNAGEALASEFNVRLLGRIPFHAPGRRAALPEGLVEQVGDLLT